MMLTIHGLPRTTKYQDVKVLLRQQCNIIDYILDNMVTDTDGLKKVRIGLSDDRDGQQLIKCLDGYRTAGHMLRVLPVGKIQDDAGDLAGMSQPSVSLICRQVALAFVTKRSNWIKMPQSDVEQNNAITNFYSICGLRQVIGAIDCTHIRIPKVTGDIGQYYINRKGYSSINVQSTESQASNYGNYNQPRDSYPQDNYGHAMPEQRPGPWDNSQFQANQQPQNNYYQGQADTPYVPQPQSQSEVFAQGSQSRMPQEQNYGYLQKSQPERNMHPPRVQEARSHVLRAVEIIDSPINRMPTQNRYPPSGQGYGSAEKPITIMKDNFQGPTQYNVRPQETSYQGQSQSAPSPWAQQQPKRTFNDDRKFPVNEKRQVMLNSSDTTARDYKGTGYPPRGGAQHVRTDSPNIRRSSPTERRISPPGRNMSAARHSPSRHRLSPPGRSISSSVALTSSGRRFSPPGRNIPSSGSRRSPGRRMSPGPNIPPSNRISPPGRRNSPSGRRFSPSGRRISPGRKISPSGRKISPSGRISPSTRRISPFGHRHSPTGHRMSPGRKMSPPGRRIAPNHSMPHYVTNMSLENRTSPLGRKMSPPGRKMSPQRTLNRRMSPDGRRMAPQRRESPRRMSPPERRARESPVRQPRFSPVRRIDKIEDKYGPAASKSVRPAYDSALAQKQAGYSSGYVQYPIAGAKQPDRRESPWQDKPTFSGAMKKDDDRSRVEFESARAVIARTMRGQGESKGPGRRSRSPLRRSRSRSVGRERYSRQSRSPSSQRRSWAFEKRSSPVPPVRTAPPPPAWHDTHDAHDTHDVHDTPQRYAGKRALDAPHQTGPGPVWERPRYDKDEPRRDDTRPDDRRFLNKEVRLEKELQMNKSIPHSSRREPSPRRGYEEVPSFAPQVRVPKFSPRDDFRRPEVESHRPENVFNKKPFFERQEPNDRQRTFDRDARPDDVPPRRPDVRNDYRKSSLILDKEIEDVHKRALEFSRKTEEFKREKRHESERHRELDKYEPRRSHEREIVDERFERETEDKSRLERKNEYERQAFYLSKKRSKAVEEITDKILAKHSLGTDSTMAKRIIEELKETISRLVSDMFGNKDVSFIEVIIKFNSKYGEKELKKIFDDVVSRFSASSRILKRSAPETSQPPAKRRSPKPVEKQDIVENANVQPSWGYSMMEQTMMAANMQIPTYATGVPMPALVDPVSFMISAPSYMQPYEEKDNQPMPVLSAHEEPHRDWTDSFKEDDGYYLYLCKDDFEPFSEIQAEILRKFLIGEIIKETETSHGWAPDFTFKGLQSLCRFELQTKDEDSMKWLVNFDFSCFNYFNLLVYTKEELWYERAAIWLPGHSRCRNIEPLDKLKMQNAKLENVNIGKWKFVKKILTTKGTRLYVDMPPSAARALEKHKMMLSYELQKVNVFLKAVAVDKDSFDNGLKEPSLQDQSALVTAAQNSPMPSLSDKETNIVKIALKGCKVLNIVIARKIKEKIIFSIYQYYQNGGSSKTDFVKYGLGQQGTYFGIVPENSESKRWLSDLNLGKLNKQAIYVLNNEDNSLRYMKMNMLIPQPSTTLKTALIMERLKQSNQGVRGLNFKNWKPLAISNHDKHTSKFEVDIDFDSIEALLKINFKIDYCTDDRNRVRTLSVKSPYSIEHLKNILSKRKAEMTDKYDVANMDLASSDDDNDVVFVS